MPEGPEIRRAADKLEAAIARQPVTEVFFAFEHLKPYEAQLRDRTVEKIATYGKALVTHFDNGLCVYSHNQLYGKWMVRRAHSYPTTRRQLRFAIHTPKKSALLYSASDIEVLPAAAVHQHPFIQRLGPDVLDATVTPEQILAWVQDPRFYRRRWTSLLLEQSFLCGVGNYLRSEILFVARLHPTHRPVDADLAQLARFADAALAVPRQSYQHNGVTNDLAIAADLKARGMPRRAYRHWVFDRSGQGCFVCGTPIVKDHTGGRRYYFCPTCQPSAGDRF
ncbi:MAG: endonuclease VIII [Leptolyngbyaceae cyanobacterium T60_A2020_046]|nr:endonuclease VIII [Leptolyngbyaceae cyanobacterium T60_A2020_046]